MPAGVDEGAGLVEVGVAPVDGGHHRVEFGRVHRLHRLHGRLVRAVVWDGQDVVRRGGAPLGSCRLVAGRSVERGSVPRTGQESVASSWIITGEAWMQTMRSVPVPVLAN